MRPLLVMDSSGTNIDWEHTCLRFAMYLAGVVVLALGMVVQTESGLCVASLALVAFRATTVVAALFLGKFVNVMSRLLAAKFREIAFVIDRVAVAAGGKG